MLMFMFWLIWIFGGVVLFLKVGILDFDLFISDIIIVILFRLLDIVIVREGGDRVGFGVINIDFMDKKVWIENCNVVKEVEWCNGK